MLAGQTHLLRQNEAELFVKGATVLGGVKDEIVEILAARPDDNFLHQAFGDPAPAPFWFGENIND